MVFNFYVQEAYGKQAVHTEFCGATSCEAFVWS